MSTDALREALRHTALEFHMLHEMIPYRIQTFANCQHAVCMEARIALASPASETEKLPAKWRSEEWCASTMTDDRPAEEICASELEAALKADRQGITK